MWDSQAFEIELNLIKTQFIRKNEKQVDISMFSRATLPLQCIEMKDFYYCPND